MTINEKVMKEFNEHQQSLIDRLFERRLPKKEQEALKKEMENEDFKEAVRSRHDLNRMFAQESKIDPLKKVMEAAEKKIPNLKKDDRVQPTPAGGRVIGLRRMMAMAAGVAILVVAGIFIMQQINGGDPVQKNYAEIKAFQKDPRLTINRKGSNAATLDSLSANCQEIYYNGGYNDALNCFSSIQDPNQPDPEIEYYQGVSQFQLEQYEEALNTFEKIINQGYFQDEQATQEQVKWNRLLAQIMAHKAGYKDELAAYASDPNFKYYSDAKQLLDILK